MYFKNIISANCKFHYTYIFSVLGYNDILLIPEGATNIFIEERKASNNYLGKSL